MSNRPRLLDLFCGAGGCSVGYHRAGFDVVGVDNRPQPRYPFAFHQGDAIQVLRDLGDGYAICAANRLYHLRDFDAIHASPPCQRYSNAAKRAGTHLRHPDSVGPCRDALKAAGLPFVIENVPGSPLRTWFKLCGTMFGLQVRRHRYFEVNWDLPVMHGLHCDHSYRVFSVFGHGSGSRNKRPDAGTVAEWRTAMGIDWMVRDELAQAIPPKYTEFIGRQLLPIVQAKQRENCAAESGI